MSNQALNIKRTVGTENVVAIQNAFNRGKAVTRTIVIMVVVFQICFLPFLINLFVIYGMEKVTDISDIKIAIYIIHHFSGAPRGAFQQPVYNKCKVRWLRVLARPLQAVHNVFLSETLSCALS